MPTPARTPARTPALAPALAAPGLAQGQRIFLWLYLFSFAFDFRGEDGGIAIQYVFAAVSIASAAGFLVTFRAARSRAVSDAFSRAVWMWSIYLISTIMGPLLLGVHPEHYLRIILPFGLCGLSLLMARAVCSVGPLWRELHKPLLYASLASAVWRPIYALTIAGVGIDEMRYQLMSPAIAFLIGYAVWSFFFASRLSAPAVAAFFLATSTTLLSITRTYLGSFVLLSVCAFFLWRAASRSAWASGRQPTGRQLGARLVVLAGVLAVAVLTAGLARPDFVENWVSRITEQNAAHDDQDITLLTRLSEYDCQWAAVCKSPFYLAFGKGVGSTYGIHSGRFRGIEGVYGKSVEANEAWYPGHSTYVYSIYSSGFMFGWIVPGFFLFGLWLSVRAVWAGRFSRRATGAMDDISVLPALVLLATLPMTFPLNVFGERFSGLLMGWMVGAACALRIVDGVSRPARRLAVARAAHLELELHVPPAAGPQDSEVGGATAALEAEPTQAPHGEARGVLPSGSIVAGWGRRVRVLKGASSRRADEGV